MSTTATRGLSPTRSVLSGGTVVIVQETATTPAVTINATMQAGGAYESRPGLAHLTGRLLDRGTAHRSADAIAEELDDHGVALRIATARHTTAVTCTCLSEDFVQMLSVVVDILRNPVFPEAEVAKRRAESLTNLRQDADNPAVRATEALFELLYGRQHPYGRPAKGTIESLEQITQADIVGFHRARFQPGLLSIVIAGDVKTADVLERAAVELEGWPHHAVEDPPVPSVTGAPVRRQRIIEMPGKSQSDIAYGFTTIRRLDPRYYAYWVMNNVLGQFGLGGRLADNIRERQGMAYYAYSVVDPSVGEGPLLVRAGVDPDNVERALAAIDHEVAAMAADGPTPDELAQSLQYLIGSIPRTFETNAGIASFLQTAEQFGLGLDYDRRLPAHLRAVTLEEVRSAAAEVLDPARAAVTIAGPVAGA